MITAIRDSLPRVLKQKVDEDHETWVEFVKTIKDLKPEYIRDEMEEQKKEEERQAQLKREILASDE
ncbi:hypothetical protein L218DRAFT_1076646 [Marasmius fiardii PR-910]|nr:hypothetical protein L218DRAFT_1076646 [Marasmius fiardii PR-910]